jgi:hypothetical protein
MGGAPACYGSSLGSNPDIHQKVKTDDISKEVANWANTLYPAQKIYIKMYSYVKTQEGKKA